MVIVAEPAYGWSEEQKKKITKTLFGVSTLIPFPLVLLQQRKQRKRKIGKEKITKEGKENRRDKN